MKIYYDEISEIDKKQLKKIKLPKKHIKFVSIKRTSNPFYSPSTKNSKGKTNE